MSIGWFIDGGVGLPAKSKPVIFHADTLPVTRNRDRCIMSWNNFKSPSEELSNDFIVLQSMSEEGKGAGRCITSVETDDKV